MTTWVVIGHGSSPVGRFWGRRIDHQATYVVRLFNFEWQDRFDYGERLDYGFIEIHPIEMRRFAASPMRQPRYGWFASRNPQHKPYSGPLPPACEEFDPTDWQRVGSDLGGCGVKGRLRLTRGCLAACAVLSRLAAYDTLILVGFDNVRVGEALSIEEGYPAAYRAIVSEKDWKWYVAGESKQGNHDFAVEGKLLLHLAQQRSVMLCHAQDVW